MSDMCITLSERVILRRFPLICIIRDLLLYDFSRLITKSFTLGSPLLFLDEQIVFIITKQDDFSSVCLIIDSCKQVYKCEAP